MMNYNTFNQQYNNIISTDFKKLSQNQEKALSNFINNTVDLQNNKDEWVQFLLSLIFFDVFDTLNNAI